MRKEPIMAITKKTTKNFDDLFAELGKLAKLIAQADEEANTFDNAIEALESHQANVIPEIVYDETLTMDELAEKLVKERVEFDKKIESLFS